MENRLYKVYLFSNSTLDLYPSFLEDTFSENEMSVQIQVGGYNQYCQDILDRKSRLYSFSPDFIVLFLNGEDLFSNIFENLILSLSMDIDNIVQKEIDQLSSLAFTINQHLPATIIFITTIYFPPYTIFSGLEYNSIYILNLIQCKFNQSLFLMAKKNTLLQIIDIASTVNFVGFKNWYDPRLWYLARARLSFIAMKELAKDIVFSVKAKVGKIKKCLVVDLDNTLWGGIVGEDGFSGIQLGSDGIGLAFVEFQKELLNLSRKGILLAICSKNNESDALEIIQKHPAMILREKDFVCMEINWEDKPTNLNKIAKKLNIGLDSIVFIDDNPAEREFVRTTNADVTVPDIPADPAYYKLALVEIERKYFFKMDLTHEDQERTVMYHAQNSREKLEQSSKNIDDFYRSLEMKMVISRGDKISLSRLAQLTQKTNQFNLTTKRYFEGDILAFIQNSLYDVYSVELVDRFGSNGIVGVFIGYQKSLTEYFIDTFLLSCRVMGRTVENAVLAYVCENLIKRKIQILLGEYIPTKKNIPVEKLYENLGFKLVSKKSDQQIWMLDLNHNKITFPEWITVEAI